MSDNKEDPNDFEDQPEVQTSAEEAAPTPDIDTNPNPKELQEAVQRALANSKPGVTQIKLEPCPCGTVNVNLMVDVAPGTKVGRATCGGCGVWGVDFLAPRSNDQDLIGKAAAKSWNEAPRILATDPA